PYQGQLAIVARDVTRFAAVNRLHSMPQAFAGTTVTTAGFIETILGPNAFVLRDPDRLQGADVLVLSQQPLWVAGQNQMQPFMFQGNSVQVTGTVQPGDNLEAILRQLGIQMDASVLGRYSEDPVLIATEITAREALTTSSGQTAQSAGQRIR
ncbi:MAG TPA: hypothetical protein VGW38_27560, partial [Chloroflexota bacterium]|nr:hypothetical protein [Chloroflexota bacterium]